MFSLFRGKANHEKWVLACLEGAWPKLLGERLATICRPAHFQDANLQIEILDSAWDQAMNGVKEAVLKKLRTATADEVRTISFSR